MLEGIIRAVLYRLLNCDSMPTGSVLLRMCDHELPERICVELYPPVGMAQKPETATYVPERTCRIIEDEDAGFLTCSECGAVQPEDYTAYWCWGCGARIEER